MIIIISTSNHSLAVVGVPLIPTLSPSKRFAKRYKHVIQSPGNDDVVIHADEKSDDDHGKTKTCIVEKAKLAWSVFVTEKLIKKTKSSAFTFVSCRLLQFAKAGCTYVTLRRYLVQRRFAEIVMPNLYE